MRRVTFDTLTAGTPLYDRLSTNYLRERGIHVYENAAGEACVALESAKQLPAIETIGWTLQRELIAEIAGLDDIRAAYGLLTHDELASAGPSATQQTDATDDAVEKLRDLVSGAPVVRAVSEIIEIAVARRATDIHLEPMRSFFRVRIRVDGILATLRTFSTDLARPIVSRVKILAALNIAERRMPQDGRTGEGAAAYVTNWQH
jgi:general secretion pathway protein E